MFSLLPKSLIQLLLFKQHIFLFRAVFSQSTVRHLLPPSCEGWKLSQCCQHHLYDATLFTAEPCHETINCPFLFNFLFSLEVFGHLSRESISTTFFSEAAFVKKPSSPSLASGSGKPLLLVGISWMPRPALSVLPHLDRVWPQAKLLGKGIGTSHEHISCDIRSLLRYLVPL